MDKETPEKHKKNSCWNLQEPEWIQSAYKFKISDCIYVHYELLEWLVDFIDNNILRKNWDLRCTVEEIFHHNLEGQVYCVRFYRRLTGPTIVSILNRSYYSIIMDVIEKLKYKMVWKSKPTYFLRVDTVINDRKRILLKALRDFDLLQFLENTYELNVGWMYIEKIEVFEFSTQLLNEQIKMIEDAIFLANTTTPSLYIVKEFAWHKIQGEFIDIDTLAMDICAEEWRHHDLFHEYNIQEIFVMDMANKDYRDSFYNGYLDRYLKILLSKWYPDLFTDNKFEYVLPDRNDKFAHYFINQFRHKISTLYAMNEKEKMYYDSYDIPFIIPPRKEIILNGSDPTPEALKTELVKYSTVTFLISNYEHFSDSLFRYLLNNLNYEQVYAINFENEFRFEVPDETLPIETTVFPMERRKIVIRIEQCNKINSEQVEHFMVYLTKLFTDIAVHENIELWLTFSDCKDLQECLNLGSVGKIFKTIAFEFTNFSAAQLNHLSRSVAKQSKLRFHHCEELQDANVIQLVANSNIEITNLIIEGSNSCTLILYFVLAEYLMKTEGVDCVRGIKFNNFQNILPNDKFKSNLTSLEFFRTEDRIEIRNFSKTVLDVYCFNIEYQDDQPPFDYN